MKNFHKLFQTELRPKLMHLIHSMKHQKTQYIQAQQQTRTSVTEITSRTAPAPGSDVLVLSEQQWLAGFQQDLMNESNLELEGLSMMILQENLYFHQVNIANPSNRPISQVVQEPIDQIIITLDQYLQIPIDHREEALRSITINT